MLAVEARGVSYSYGSVHALRDLDLSIPEGTLYALLGPNGSGKTTLLQILMGLRRAHRGRVSLFDIDSHALTLRDRTTIGYIAEGQPLPGWMRLEQLEAYLAPLYPTWDFALAKDLRERFSLDPTRKVKTLSRGEHMKAALLCSLAPRPRLLIMDEPFTGMDALVKDDLVRGLLGSSGSEGWTVLLCSHDIGELELLADSVGILDAGRLVLSESMDAVRDRFKQVEITLGESNAPVDIDAAWMAADRNGARLSVLLADDGDTQTHMMSRFPTATRIDVRSATMRELFVAIARRKAPAMRVEVAA